MLPDTTLTPDDTPTSSPSDSQGLSIIGQSGNGKLFTGVFGGVGKWGINTVSVNASVLNLNGNMTIGSSYLGTAAPVNGMIIEGSVGIGTTAFGTSGVKVIAVGSGTAPSSSPADSIQMYSADIVAGNAAPHFRTENGAVVKIYQETTGVAAATVAHTGGGTNIKTDDTFDGYTMAQIAKALRNLGILA